MIDRNASPRASDLVALGAVSEQTLAQKDIDFEVESGQRLREAGA